MNSELHLPSEHPRSRLQKIRGFSPIRRILGQPKVRRILDDPDFQDSYEIAAPTLAVMVLGILLMIAAYFGVQYHHYRQFYHYAATGYAEGAYFDALGDIELALDLHKTADAYLLESEIYMGLDQLDNAIETLYVATLEHHSSPEITERLEELKALRATMLAGLEETEIRYVTIGSETVDLYQTALDLSALDLTDESTAQLEDFIYLSSLDLSDNQISNLEPLSRLISLRVLKLSGNPISDLSALSHLSSLQSLSLNGCTATDFTPLYNLKGLTRLSLKGVSMSSKQLKELQTALPNCTIAYDEDRIRAVKALTLGGVTFDSDVEMLDLSGLGLTDLSVLSDCTNLHYLDLRDNAITDLSPLQDLTTLQWLCLWNNQITDLQPLKPLQHLSYLDLEQNNISDLRPLSSLPALKELWLNKNPITEFTPLYEMRQLTRLGLNEVGLYDSTLGSLTGLSALEELTISGNAGLTALQVQTLRFLLPNCVVICAQYPEISSSLPNSKSDTSSPQPTPDTPPTSSNSGTYHFGSNTIYAGQSSVDASDAFLHTIPALDDFFAMTHLILRNNLISDLSPLKEQTGLLLLDLRSNLISDLSPLSELISLQTLYLSDNQISDLSPLSGLTSLQALYLDDNAISDLSPLESLVQLQTLDLSDNPIFNLDALSNLTALTALSLRNCAVSDLAFLDTLPNLRILDLSGNAVPDLDLLMQLTGLTDLYLTDVPLTAAQLVSLQAALPNCTIHTTSTYRLEETDMTPHTA